MRIPNRHDPRWFDKRLHKGGSSSTTTGPTTTTTNVDRRAALQDSVQATEGSTVIDQSQRADAEVLRTLADAMPDAVKFMASAGADVIKSAGGSVVDLNRDSLLANQHAFDGVLDFGARAVDRLIDASTKTNAAGVQLAQTAMSNYSPPEAKSADVQKWALIAAAGAVALVMLGKAK